MIAQPLERAIGGEPGAHQRPGECRRQRVMIEQITRMRHQDVSREPAVDRNAEMMMRGAHVLFAGAASRASSAADPRIDRSLLADCDILRTFTCGFDDPCDLMTERKRQSTVFGDIEPFIAAQREITVLHVQVRMAYPAASHSDENLGAARHRAFRDRLAQWRSIGDERLAAKCAHAVLSPEEPAISIALWRPR